MTETQSLMEQEIGTDALELKGYRILLKAVVLPETTKGGIILPEAYKKLERRVYNIGLVIAMGSRCYQPLEKFGGEPYCKVGDWVYYSSYEREEALVNDHLCFFINDERVYSVIKDIKAVVKELR